VEDQRRRTRLRSFALGGLVGAAGAIATGRRLRAASLRPRNAQGGLGAFEDAPCFREIAEHDAQTSRDGAHREGGAASERPGPE
jgi:hypothetical protein